MSLWGRLPEKVPDRHKLAASMPNCSMRGWETIAGAPLYFLMHADQAEHHRSSPNHPVLRISAFSASSTKKITTPTPRITSHCSNLSGALPKSLFITGR